MDILLIALTLLVMLIGLVGVFLPVVPDVWLIWLAAVVYGLFQQPLYNGWLGGVAVGVITLLAVAGTVIDWLGGHAGAAAQGNVSWQAWTASFILGLAGLIFFPPFGPLAGAALGLFVVELIRHQRNWRKAVATVRGYLTGVGLSVVARVVICITMIGVWALWVIVARLFLMGR